MKDISSAPMPYDYWTDLYIFFFELCDIKKSIMSYLYEFLLVLASLEVVVDVLSTDLVAVVLYLQPRQGLVGLYREDI